MSTKSSRFVIYFFIILFCSVAIRVINIRQPILEGASTRQVENAMIARNYFNNQLNILYPYLTDNGNQKVYQLVEFQGIPFLAAVIHRLRGEADEANLRSISIFFFVLASIMLFKLAEYYFSTEIAFYSAIVFMLSPLSIYLSRAFQNEMPMIAFAVSAIYFFSRYLEQKSLISFIASAICLEAAILLKIPNLYLFIPLLFLAYIRFGKRLWTKPFIYLFLLFIGAIAFFWYRHAHYVMTTYPNKYSIYFTGNFGYMLNNLKHYLPQVDFYKVHFDNLVTYTLTPIGFSLLILGLLIRFNDRRQRVIYIWLAGVFLFFVIVPAQSWQGYYQIHLLPIFSILIGNAVYKIKNSKLLEDNFLDKRIVASIFSIIILFTVFRYSYAYYKVPENFRYVVETGKAIDLLTEKDALVICSIENGPDLVYYSNRKGWPFTIDLEAKRKLDILQGEDVTGRTYDPVIYLEQLRAEGASYFASASMSEFLGHEKFSKYMRENYKVVKETPHFIVFDLRNKR
ncbi:MAG: glycosyltransferase family 39 protein [Candidatus Omnitrophota bacterium]|nr:glycosyltransferase family 39 protein [Candidatus Omnitrophota bacterium]